jgi:alpha-1,6-mannosyltransferase
MTGASLFGEIRPHWKYSKEESHDPSNNQHIDVKSLPYTHLITKNAQFFEDYYEPIAVIEGYAGLNVNKDLKSVLRNFSLPLSVLVSPKLVIVQRKQ